MLELDSLKEHLQINIPGVEIKHITLQSKETIDVKLSLFSRDTYNISYGKDCYSVFKGGQYVFCADEQKVLEFLNEVDIKNSKKYLFENIKLHFWRSCKYFDYSNNVKFGDSTLFTVIMKLEHKDNSNIKKLFGLNKYFVVLLSCVYTDERIMYCISAYDGTPSSIIAGESVNDIVKTLPAVLKTNYNFELKV